jgi:hypothetical protein
LMTAVIPMLFRQVVQAAAIVIFSFECMLPGTKGSVARSARPIVPSDLAFGTSFDFTTRRSIFHAEKWNLCRLKKNKAHVGYAFGRDRSLTDRSRLSSMMSENDQSTVQSTNHRIREVTTDVGGSGLFLRSPKFLEMIIDEETKELEIDLLPPLESLLERLAPQEQSLSDLKRKYEETENEIFGSQIRPLEIRLQPLQQMKEEQEYAVLSQRQYIEELTELRDQAIESHQRHQSEGRADVFYSGFNRTWSVDMNRNFALGPDGEAEFSLAPKKNGGFEIVTKWANRNSEQPLLIEGQMKQDGACCGLIISFATPEEGPKRLCAVCEWSGDVKSDDVSARTQQLLNWLRLDQLKVADSSKCLVSTWSDAVPMRRRNELWVELVPPEAGEWIKHAGNIATDLPARNASLYQLKDCPWATPTPYGATGLHQGGAPGPVVGWSASTALLGGGNLLTVSVSPAPTTAAAGVAVDKSSTGEVAVWAQPECLDALQDAVLARPAQPAAEGPARRALYAAADVPDAWPLTGGAVEAARARLVQSVAAEGRHAAADPLSFRLRVPGPGRRAEVWTRVDGTRPEEH